MAKIDLSEEIANKYQEFAIKFPGFRLQSTAAAYPPGMSQALQILG